MNKIFIATLLVFSSFMAIAASVEHIGIAEAEEFVKPMKRGQALDNVCLEDIDQKTVCTDDVLSSKPTILIVYRGGWCPYCNAQLNRLMKIEKQLTALGFQLIAVSPDSNKNIKDMKQQDGISYTLLTDNKLELSKALGLAYFLDKDVEAKYRNKLGVPFIDINGDSRVSLPVPAVYIFDQKGKVHYQYISPKYQVRVDEQILLKNAKQAMQSIKSMK
ncbi:AhpC/TSA family protein [Psychrosphaera sp. B3R10]|uniref:peroxiredoxin-like family protein n=1 Tax=unclassified Psychrosphaera TaxID=2641570 RepID=UPI001C0A387C|nr:MULTISPECIES: peroxiredoxin-like family protein [unclassified Psychrosphaera]MBU2882496.1 AhpC/TSA family protein [Psychrosphaera sp. I2R16]MBU2990317.1 AhpC/TSA family protein [Psychrosphaera sp. B3R10]